MLNIPHAAYVALRQHGEDAYPQECCGILLGRFDEDGTKTVTQVIRCLNMREDSPSNRYSIDLKELVRLQREGRERGEDIVGFYHSHPDHPPLWSQTDLEEAYWIGCSYVITCVENKKAGTTKSFHLAGTYDDKRFVEEEISTGEPGLIEKND